MGTFFKILEQILHFVSFDLDDGSYTDYTDDNDDSSSSGNSSEWDDAMTDDPMGDDDICNIEVSCLFCTQTFKCVEDGIKHCSNSHEFDLVSFKNKFNMDCYSYIKMVNYIRTNNPDPTELANDVTVGNKLLWDDDKYLKPFMDDDPWLVFDFEDLDDMDVARPLNTGDCSKTPDWSLEGGHHVNSENGLITLSELHFSELQKKIQVLNSQKYQKELLLKDAEDTISRMRRTLNNMISSDSQVSGNSNDMHSSKRCVGSVAVNEDEHYFSSYSHFGIHHEMLSDKVRTETYRDAIMQCVKGKKVMDLGCGTGILSMFAASGGAEKVIAVDQSDIIYQAIDIIRENGLDERITAIKGRLEDTPLPDGYDKVDVIVSEWMGYFLLFEGMLDSVIYARDHHLAPNGLLLPNRCSISIAGFHSPGRHKELVEFWSDVYGYKMSCMKKEVVREGSVELVSKDDQITDCCQVFALDLMAATVDSVNFSTDFSLSVSCDSELTSIVGHFDVFFDLKSPIVLSTSPSAESTHWKQTVFYLKKPITVKQGEVLPGRIVCQRHMKDVRSLTVTIVIKEHKQTFVMH